MPDELEGLADVASELGLPWTGPPAVARQSVVDAVGLTVSALAWGDAPRLALLHGGGQNAHSWDGTALALDRPLLAVDLPGHGRSDWRPDHDYRPAHLAAGVAAALERLATSPVVLVGMSMGGMAAAAVAAARPDLVAGLVLVDVTPDARPNPSDATVRLLRRDRTFPSFEALLSVTAEHNPHRSEASLRRGLLHNARPLPDGRWTWRYDDLDAWTDDHAAVVDPVPLWRAIAELDGPVHLVRGGRSSVVGEADVAHLRRLRPDAAVTTIEGAGHNVQGDQPLALAATLASLS